MNVTLTYSSKNSKQKLATVSVVYYAWCYVFLCCVISFCVTYVNFE